MNKCIKYIIILLFISNCSFTKNENNENENLVDIFQKTQPIEKEFNQQLKIKELNTIKQKPFIKNNRKYILDLKWLSAHSKEYARFNNNLYEFVIDISKRTKFPQNDISFMITSVMAVCINLGDEMLTRSDVSPDDASNFATKLFLKGL